jgi:septum formation protein
MLVLASQSPRRLEILQRAGLHASVRVSGVPEDRLPDEQPLEYVRRLARAKAEAVDRTEGEIVLGADTIVTIQDEILEKPHDAENARAMLTKLSGQVHTVLTGICLRHDRGIVVDAEETRVRFLPLSAQDIREYVNSGEPMDKAGAYAIQGLASKFIDRVEGCYFNVVGLPISRVYRHLKDIDEQVVWTI